MSAVMFCVSHMSEDLDGLANSQNGMEMQKGMIFLSVLFPELYSKRLTMCLYFVHVSYMFVQFLNPISSLPCI
jgi:hypothetical protein